MLWQRSRFLVIKFKLVRMIAVECLEALSVFGLAELLGCSKYELVIESSRW